MKVTYLRHSGFKLELEHHILIFDYFKGNVGDLSKKEVIVFSSHRHFDHFRKEIFDWREKTKSIHYVLSDDIQGQDKELQEDADIRWCAPDERFEMKGCTVQTLRSTDEGVAFLVECEGVRIYHAGDLNWWHWEGEPGEFNETMKKDYQREIAKIEGKKFDVAFIPVDARLGEQYFWGLDWFMRHTDTRWAVPMHFFEDYSVCKRLELQEETNSYRDRLILVHGQGETFEI
ncbi:MBL fold metallo-hydrolase [Lachnoclostridium sp. An181]|uniref:MBL fold metallo-hydrolase n=1 Tax=Lachnoclostridium sp. An181 TaxID=1965575 RepID=UPI000B373F66|nr:MBL fold metallo-hydrolase [Lachnoclostridium sp. An181]OUP50556.1 hydrolase [Lachnoclostridium sp. An181]